MRIKVLSSGELSMKKVLIPGIIMVLLLAGMGTVSANLVQNPSFESPGRCWDLYLHAPREKLSLDSVDHRCEYKY